MKYNMPDGSMVNHVMGCCHYCPEQGIYILCKRAYCKDCFPKAEALYHSLLRVKETEARITKHERGHTEMSYALSFVRDVMEGKDT